jgi:hypothetical protein
MVVHIPMFKPPKCAGYGARASVSCRRDATWVATIQLTGIAERVPLCNYCKERFWRNRANRAFATVKKLPQL